MWPLWNLIYEDKNPFDVYNYTAIENKNSLDAYNYTVLHLAAQFGKLDTWSNVKFEMIIDIFIAIQTFEEYLMEKASFFAIYLTIYLAKQMNYYPIILSAIWC